MSIRTSKNKKLSTQNVGKDVQQPEFSHTFSGNVERHNHFGKQLGNFLKSKTYTYHTSYSTSYSTLRSLSKRNEIIYPSKTLS